MIFEQPGKYDIAWLGMPKDTGATGYWASNEAIVKALADTNVVVHRVDEPGSGAEDCEVGVCYTPVMNEYMESLPSPYRILLSMFEADRWPRTWVSGANCANQVWVPSAFCRESLLASDCESPVHVVPFGIDAELFTPDRRRRKQGTPYTFGYFGAASLRKGFDLLVQAFAEEFAADEPVRLVIASSNMLSATAPQLPNVECRIEQLTPKQLRDFYRSVDCFVSPSRGEGFALCPLEAMACGCCAATTAWGGQVDYMDSRDTLRIAIERLESCGGYVGSDGRWALPRMETIRYCMRWAYEHPDEAAAAGLAASDRVRKEWTWARTAARIEELLRRVQPGDRVEVETQEVVVWRGNPRQISTPVGGFVRGEPRILSADQASALDFSDGRFKRERRYKRRETAAT